jgi:hypothetical protein
MIEDELFSLVFVIWINHVGFIFHFLLFESVFLVLEACYNRIVF